MDARTKDILETVDLKKVNIMSFASGYNLEASRRGKGKWTPPPVLKF